MIISSRIFQLSNIDRLKTKESCEWLQNKVLLSIQIIFASLPFSFILSFSQIFPVFAKFQV